MDFDKVNLKIKMNAKGTHYIAYCEEYPQIQGVAPSEDLATQNFWRAFANLEDKIEHEKIVASREEKSAA